MSVNPRKPIISFSMDSEAVLNRIKSAADGLKGTFARGGSVQSSQPVRVFFWEDSATIGSQAWVTIQGGSRSSLRKGKVPVLLNATDIV